MIQLVAEILLLAVLAYVGVGFYVAWRYVRTWSGRVDSAAQHGNRWFRFAIFPAAIALWPCLIGRLKHNAFDFNPGLPASAPAALRRVNGPVFFVLLVLLPLLAWAALAGRAPAFAQWPVAPVSFSVPAALPVELVSGPISVAGVTLQTSLRSSSEGARQIEIRVPAALNEPALAVYWSDQQPRESLPADAVFLGLLWGPHVFRFALPTSSLKTKSGTLYFQALASDADEVKSLYLEVR